LKYQAVRFLLHSYYLLLVIEMIRQYLLILYFPHSVDCLRYCFRYFRNPAQAAVLAAAEPVVL
jgi:hypothetical protein